MKIYDFFLFNHEIDLLALRIDYSKDTIAHFYAFESQLTHSGEPKKLYSEEFKIKYPELLSFVTFINVDLPVQATAWEREAFTRCFYLQFALQNHFGSVGIFTDLDEFVDPQFFNDFKIEEHLVYNLEMIWFQYNPTTCYKDIVSDVSLVSMITNNFCQTNYRVFKPQTTIKGYGYHFGNFLDSNDLIVKLQSNWHTEYNSEEYTQKDILENRIANKIDFVGRENLELVEYDFELYPDKLKLLFKTKYKFFL